VIPYEYIILNYIQHTEPKEIIQFDKFMAGNQLGKLLKEIHQIKVDGFGIPKNNFEW